MRAWTGAVCLTGLLVAGCGGSEDGNATGGGAGSTSSTTAVAPTDSPGGGEPSTASSTTTSTASGAPVAASADPAPELVGARPGTYRYRVVGTTSGGTPPTTKPHDSSSTLTVFPAAGREQRSEQRSPEGQGTDLLLRHDADGVRLVSMHLRGQLEKEFRPDPQPLMMKAGAAAGDRWTVELTSTDGTTTMRDDIAVVGRERVTVGGRSVDAVKVHHDVRVTTSFNGAPITVTIDRTAWESPAHVLSVKEHVVTDVPGFVHDESTSTLESLDPS